MFHPEGPKFWELARQALSSTQKGYDLLAPKFDYSPFCSPDEVIDAALGRLSPENGLGTVLDLCCGTGAAMARLSQYPTERIVGLDFSQGMLVQAAQKLKASGAEGWELVQADALSFELINCFDLVVSFGAFGHIPVAEEPQFCARIYRALRPGGRFAFVTAHYPKRRSLSWVVSSLFNLSLRLRNLLPGPPFIMYYLTFSLPQVATLLEQVGFEVEVQEMPVGSSYPSLRVVVAHKGLPKPS